VTEPLRPKSYMASKPRLGQVVDVTFLVVCVVLVIGVVRNVLSPAKPEPSRAVSGFLERGSASPLDALPASPAGKVSTVVVVMSSTCHWCAEQIPFYLRLERIAQTSSFKVAYVSPEEQRTFSAYLVKNGLDPSLRANAILTSRIKATPTLVVLDLKQRVLQSFQGPLSTSQQAELLDSIR